jgi:hypothetical protein
VGRASWGSSFLDERGATFFRGKRGRGTKKEKSSKKERKEGLWKLTLLMEIRKERGFTARSRSIALLTYTIRRRRQQREKGVDLRQLPPEGNPN